MADQSVDMRFKFPHQMFLVGECQHLVLNKSLYILCFVRNIWWANIWSKSDENKWNNNVWCSPLHQVRSIISDFAVFFTILTMVLVDYALGIPSPKLQVPSVFKVRKISSPDLFDQQIANSQHFSASCCSCLTNNNTFFFPPFLSSANQRWSGLVHQPSGAEPLVDRSHHGGSSSALYHPHLHGPADHSRHYQPEGAQTQGTWVLALNFSCTLVLA